MLISATVLPDLLGPRKIPVHGTRGTTGSEGCLLLYSAVGNSLIFPISFALLPKFDAGKPASETGINLKAGMRVKYMGSKSWLAPHVDRLLGDELHSPFFGSGKLEYYLAARRPADAFEPVANLHRCYLRQDPVFLPQVSGLIPPGPPLITLRAISTEVGNPTSLHTEVGFPTAWRGPGAGLVRA